MTVASVEIGGIYTDEKGVKWIKAEEDLLFIYDPITIDEALEHPLTPGLLLTLNNYLKTT